MPQNKRESLIYTVIMCAFMVLWMSIYNVSLQYGAFSLEAVIAGWIGFPIAYVFAMCCDWFVVSKLAKGIAFRYLVKPEDCALKKILCISGGMVVGMVIIMSLYGACEGPSTPEPGPPSPQIGCAISPAISSWPCPSSS